MFQVEKRYQGVWPGRRNGRLGTLGRGDMVISTPCGAAEFGGDGDWFSVGDRK